MIPSIINFQIKCRVKSKKHWDFFGMETYREATGKGVTISYWESKKAIQQWKENAKHLLAQQYGKAHAYSRFEIKICRVESAYEFKATDKN